MENWTYQTEPVNSKEPNKTSGGVIARLSLNRPDEMNALNYETLDELRDICRQINTTPGIRALILSGTGKHFSAGMDVSIINMLTEATPETYRKNLRESQLCIDALEELKIPTIAAIRGFCIGGGMILSACCDFRLAGTKSVFSLPEVKRSIGVIMGTTRISRLIGIGATKEMAMTGDRFNARDLFRFGFLTRLVEDERLETEALRLARKLSALPPLAVALNKEIIDHTYGRQSREAQDFEIIAQEKILKSADFKEAMDSFFEKRKGIYRGE